MLESARNMTALSVVPEERRETISSIDKRTFIGKGSVVTLNQGPHLKNNFVESTPEPGNQAKSSKFKGLETLKMLE